jgi:hypothetical protein
MATKQATKRIDKNTLRTTTTAFWRVEAIFAAIIALKAESHYVEELANIGKEIADEAYTTIAEI